MAGMVKRYHGSFPSFSYEFDSRYPLHFELPKINENGASISERASDFQTCEFNPSKRRQTLRASFVSELCLLRCAARHR